MANFDIYFPRLIKKEGGFVNHPSDPGGATNKGITIANWKAYGTDKDNDGDIDVNDLKFITDQDAKDFYRRRFWNKMSLDLIRSQDLAEIVLDHAVNAGISRGVKMLQFILYYQFSRKEVKINGVVDRLLPGIVNSVSDQAKLFNAYSDFRKAYYAYRSNQKGRNPAYDSFFKSLKVTPSDTAKVFYAGWVKRVEEFGKKKVPTSV
jgi:lysozyme family protein